MPSKPETIEAILIELTTGLPADLPENLKASSTSYDIRKAKLKLLAREEQLVREARIDELTNLRYDQDNHKNTGVIAPFMMLKDLDDRLAQLEQKITAKENTNGTNQGRTHAK